MIEQVDRLYTLLLRGGIENRRRLIIKADLNLLRIHLDFLMLHAIILRGESTQKAELVDLYSVLLPNESLKYLSLILRISAGKTISLAIRGNLRMQHYHAALRHRDLILCPVSALAH